MMMERKGKGPETLMLLPREQPDRVGVLAMVQLWQC